MKLIYRILSRVSVALLLLLAVWATLFYYIIVEEINDETDDALEDYSEYIIVRALAGEALPEADNGTNNSYYIREVSPEYAAQTKQVEYLDQEVYLHSKKETEPARVLRTIFRDGDGRHHELTVLIPTFEKSDLQETILSWIIVLYVVLLLAIIACNGWILYRSLRPLYTLLDWLDSVTLGGAIPPLNNETNVTEFRRLNEAMLRNARRNNEMYEEQQAFIGNASHEMQTPIAICKNRLELLANDPALNETQLEEVIKTGQALDHLAKLNRTLLLLTKIENRQFPESVSVEFGPLIASLAEDYAEVYAARGVAIRLREEAPLHVVMNDSLASVLLSNLLKNAVIHSPQGGSVDVVVFAEGISVSNTASGGPLDADQIFRRFYQQNKQTGSLGLGLALVDSIVRLYGMAVRYEYADGMHRFTVNRPS